MHYRDGFLIQTILYTALWLYDEYAGLLICIIMATILLALLLLSLFFELIEKSKVPRAYFIWMLISIFPPILVSLVFYLISGGKISWIDQN